MFLHETFYFIGLPRDFSNKSLIGISAILFGFVYKRTRINLPFVFAWVSVVLVYFAIGLIYFYNT